MSVLERPNKGNTLHNLCVQTRKNKRQMWSQIVVWEQRSDDCIQDPEDGEVKQKILCKWTLGYSGDGSAEISWEADAKGA